MRKIWQIPGQEAAEAKVKIVARASLHCSSRWYKNSIIYLISDSSSKFISYHLSLDALTFVSLKIISSDIWEEKKYGQQMIGQWTELVWNSLKYQNLGNSLTVFSYMFYLICLGMSLVRQCRIMMIHYVID